MPEFDATTQTKIAALRALRAAGETLEAYEMVKVDWPSPDGTIYYACTPVDMVASVAPSVTPIEVRLVPGSDPDWFMPLSLGAAIGDEEVSLEFRDVDEAIEQLMVDHGEGIKATLLCWLPQGELLLTVWHGHLRREDESEPGRIRLKAMQGYRSSDCIVPGRAHWQECQGIFGGLLTTQDQIDEHDCPFNFHIGGGIGNNNPATSAPWTYCDRREPASCTTRGVNPFYHLSHKTQIATVVSGQSHGPNLLSTSQGNETNLDEPVRVVMGRRRIYDMKVMAFRRDLNNNTPDRGWFFAMYEACEGPIQAIKQAKITIDNVTQNAIAMHYWHQLGEKGQVAEASLTPHAYSGTAFIRYNFGWLNPANVDQNNAVASAIIEGLNNIRVYTDAEAYTETYTDNRVWHIARILCDKRWGYGLDYARLDIDSFIEAAEWCDEYVRFTDAFGTNWDHVRSMSQVELIGKKVQQQIDDMCMAGRLSRPFLFNGKIHIMPLRALTEEELDACPVFTDEGDDQNIIWEGEGSEAVTSLRVVPGTSDLELINRVECNFDDYANDFKQQPLAPVEDIDAQLAAGRVTGDNSRKTNKKEYPLLGVVYKPQAIKAAWTLLDLGPFDEGGLQNNHAVKFKVWFADAIDLHPHKVIAVASSRLTKYGFDYYRIRSDGIKRLGDLTYEITAQAYPVEYMDALETVITPTSPTTCPIGQHWDPVLLECVDNPPPPPCRPGFGDVTYEDGILSIPVPPC